MSTVDAQKLTQKSLEAVKNAQSMAIEYNNMQIENLHLAYALLSDSEGLIPQLVSKMGVQPAALLHALQSGIERLPKVTGPGREPDKVYISQDVDRALNAAAKTAKEGRWEKGPGMKLWEELSKHVTDPQIVAEDLGIIDDGVREYLKKTGFPGMRVLQFAFDGSKDNPHLPYNYDKNIVAYTATHDNDTSLGWLYSLDQGAREDVLDFIGVGAFEWGAGGKHCKSTKAMIKAISASSANTVVFPMQDLTGYGSDTRINIPGVAEGNWEFRITLSTLEDVDADFLRKTFNRYGRV